MKLTAFNRTINVTARHVGLLVVIFALCVTIPRLVFAFALSDGLALNEQVEFNLLLTSAIAGAIVLTTGNAFLSHILADTFHQRNALWYITASAWGANLLFAVFLIAPTLMVGMQRSALANILRVTVDPIPAGLMQWMWCITAALAFELLAAGSMAGYAIASRVTLIALPAIPTQSDTAPDTSDQDEALNQLSDALSAITTRLDSITDLAHQVGTLSNRIADLEARPAITIPPPSAKQRVHAILDAQGSNVDNAWIAEQTGIPANSVRAYRAAWLKEHATEAALPIAHNGNGHHA